MRCRIGSLGLKVLALVFTLVLGVSLTRIVDRTLHPRISVFTDSEVISNHLDYASFTRVNFCDLMAAPEAYEGKMLLLTIKPHGRDMLHRDELCLEGNPKFDIEFVGGMLRQSAAEKFWHGGEMTLAGRFSKSPIAGDSTKYQFQIIQIYQARLFVAP